MDKDVLLARLNAVGCFALLRGVNQHRAVVAMFHRFGPGASRTSAPVFDAQVNYLREHYRVVPLSELHERLRAGGAGARRLAAITIDDGYRDCLDVAMPILRKHGVPATVFVTTAFIAGRDWIWTDKLRYLARTAKAGAWTLKISGERLHLAWTGLVEGSRAADLLGERLKCVRDSERERLIGDAATQLELDIPTRPPQEFAAMTWSELRASDGSALEIGAHTVTHPVLTQVDATRLQAELRDARAELAAELRHPVDLFCYPNGDNDDVVRRAVADAGYVCAVTTEAGLNDPGRDPLRLKRVHTAPDLVRFIDATCGFEELKVAIRRFVPSQSPDRSRATPLAGAQVRA